jgi:hypothetical protein
MSLELKSLLSAYRIPPNLEFFWQKGKSVDGLRYPLLIPEKYLDFVKVVLGLHLIETEFPQEKIRELTVETSFKKDFNLIKDNLQKVFHDLTNHTV